MLASRRLAPLLVLGLALLGSSACFTGGDGAYCVEGLLGRRDPSSGACVLFRAECTDLGPVAVGTMEPLPTWATCEPDACERFDAETCRAHAGCHPAYVHSTICTSDYRLVDTRWFHGCWTVAPPDGVSESRPCDVLDAEGCSRRDDCAPLYGSIGQGPGFDGCTSEDDPTPRDAKHPRTPPQPPPNPRRDPQTGECREANVPYCTEPPSGWPDWGPCSGACEAFAATEPGCILADGCRAIYAGTPAVYAACWQVPPSGPVRGTPCEGLDAYECSRHDDCAAEHELDASLGVTAFVACRAEAVAP